jgi:hypothetical protein
MPTIMCRDEGCLSEIVVSFATYDHFRPSNDRNSAGRVDERGLQWQIVVGRLWFVSTNGHLPWSKSQNGGFYLDFAMDS